MYLNQNYICQSCNAQYNVLTVQELSGSSVVLKSGYCPCPCGGMIEKLAEWRRPATDGVNGIEPD